MIDPAKAKVAALGVGAVGMFNKQINSQAWLVIIGLVRPVTANICLVLPWHVN